VQRHAAPESAMPASVQTVTLSPLKQAIVARLH
jgi:hypothetical protein